MSTPNDIRPFADDGSPLSDEQLLAYLEGRLSDADSHAIEKQMAEDLAGSDALEGLQSLGAPEARRLRGRIDQRVRQSLGKKKGRRRSTLDQRWIWLTVVIVLLLAIAAYCVLHFMKKP